MQKTIFAKASQKKQRVDPDLLRDLQDSYRGSLSGGERGILLRLRESRHTPHAYAYAPHTPEGTILGELKALLKFLPEEISIFRDSFKVVPPGRSRVKVTAKLKVSKGLDITEVENQVSKALDRLQGSHLGPGNEIMFDVSDDLTTINFEKYHF